MINSASSIKSSGSFPGTISVNSISTRLTLLPQGLSFDNLSISRQLMAIRSSGDATRIRSLTSRKLEDKMEESRGSKNETLMDTGKPT